MAAQSGSWMIMGGAAVTADEPAVTGGTPSRPEAWANTGRTAVEAGC